MDEDDADDADEADAPTDVTVTIPLDEVHQPIVKQLRDAGFDVEGIARAAAQDNVESALYDTFMASKYDEIGDQ